MWFFFFLQKQNTEEAVEGGEKARTEVATCQERREEGEYNKNFVNSDYIESISVQLTSNYIVKQWESSRFAYSRPFPEAQYEWLKNELCIQYGTQRLPPDFELDLYTRGSPCLPQHRISSLIRQLNFSLRLRLLLLLQVASLLIRLSNPRYVTDD